jgi:peptide/nickel transport system substrate-binding protein
VKKPILIIISFMLLFSLIISSCSNKTTTPTTTASSLTTTPPASTTTPASTIKKGGVLRYIMTEGPTGALGYAPDMTMGYASRQVLCCVESLLVFDSKGNEHPMLATTWDWSSDYLSVTFHLRQGVKFHDGSDFNADAVKWNWETAMGKKLSGTTVWKSIDVINEYTIRMNFTKFTNNLLYAFAEGASCEIFSPTAFQTLGLEGVRWHPVGTGPFKFKAFEADNYIEYEKNANYWQEGKPYLNGVKYIFIADGVTAGIYLKAGEADMFYQVGGGKELAAELQTQGYNILLCQSYFATLVTDSANPDSPFANIKVREALEYAINREQIAETVGLGFWIPINQPASSFQDTYIKNFQGRDYNPEKAKQLLEEAGYGDGFTTTLYCGTQVMGAQVTAIQAYLLAVNIKANIEEITPAKWMEMEQKGWTDGIMYSPQGTTMSFNFNSYLDRYYAENSIVYPNIAKSSELLDLIAKSETEPDTAKHKEEIQQIIRMLFDEATVVPLWDSTGIYILKSYVIDAAPADRPADIRIPNFANCWLDK